MSEKILVISGSHRLNSQSDKVSIYISEALNSKGMSSSVLSLSGNPLPLWDEEGLKSSDSEFSKIWTPMSQAMSNSDAFVIVVPEWGGMVPSGLKNLLLLATKGELSHKPALIVAVSAGINGAYPVSELRMSGYKNSRICFIPEHVIVRNVADVLNEDASSDPRDTSIRERMNFSLELLISYSKALKEVRSSSLEFSKYPNGM
jgi:NAD(P)H-dependent FMN reductase